LSEEENAAPKEEDVGEPIQIMDIFNQSLKSVDLDGKKLLEEVIEIKVDGELIRATLNKPYNVWDKVLPGEFDKPEDFISNWDKMHRALGHTIFMILPPKTFESMEMLQSPSPQPQQVNPQQPIVITTGTGQNAQPSGRQPSRGAFGGFWDWRIAKAQLKALLEKVERPTIISEKITYNPKDIVYQLIPTLNQIKSLYFKYLDRHQSYEEPSPYLVKDGHSRLRKVMSMYFNVLNPFCYASIVYQKEKLRKDRLQHVASFSRIIEAQSMYGMMGMGPSGGGGPPAKQDSLGLQMYVDRAVQRELSRRERERGQKRRK